MKKVDTIYQEKGLLKRREPFGFMLKLGVMGIGLMFSILILIYLSRMGHTSWYQFRLPKIFAWSTAVILLSSFALHQANLAIRDDLFLRYRVFLTFTLFLGITFCYLQYLGWVQMQKMGVFLNKSLAGAFIYVISGLHVLHILGGIFFLTIAWIEAIRYRKYVDSFVYSVNPPNQLRLRLITYYWHFVDILWVFLFLLFVLNH